MAVKKAVSAQRTHILEGSRSDVVIADTLRTEADVHALHVGIRVILAVTGVVGVDVLTDVD